MKKFSKIQCREIYKPVSNLVILYGFLVFSGGIKWEHWPEMG